MVTTNVSHGHQDETNSDGFESVVKDGWARVHAYICLLQRHPRDADDLTADTFERAYRAWAQGRRPAGAIMPWLLVIARNLVIDRERRRKILSWIPFQSKSELPADNRLMHEVEGLIWFAELRRTLSHRQYEALLLRYQFDLNNDQIGQIMGLSPAAVRTLVSRAIGVLRRHPEVLD